MADHGSTCCPQRPASVSTVKRTCWATLMGFAIEGACFTETARVGSVDRAQSLTVGSRGQMTQLCLVRVDAADWCGVRKAED